MKRLKDPIYGYIDIDDNIIDLLLIQLHFNGYAQ